MMVAQSPADEQTALLKTILQRMDDLDRQNQELRNEIRTLRELLPGTQAQPAATPPSPDNALADKVAVNERRIEEHQQTKVEASQKWPVVLSGLVLFNAFENTGDTYSKLASQSYPDLLSGPNTAGATLRQTLVGLSFQGPQIAAGGRVSGFVSLDLSGGQSEYVGGIRLRRAGLTLDWEHRGISVGQDKPLISQRAPDSLAEVAAPALSGSGNLWLWSPQLRYEERYRLGLSTGLVGQVEVLQTAENFAMVPTNYAGTLEATRPAFESRAAIWHSWADEARVELGLGGHTSQTHVASASVPSRIASIDLLIQPSSWLKMTGTYFSGENLANIGGPYQAFTVLQSGSVKPVRGDGGWLQLSFPVTQRLTFNTYGGWQSVKDRDLAGGQVDGTNTFAGNVIFRLGPNLLFSFEAARKRFDYFPNSKYNIAQNHYDLALGYAF